MKHNGIIAIVFIVGCATGGVAAQLVVPPVRAGTSPTRWEYQCAEAGFIADGSLTAKLNQLCYARVPHHDKEGNHEPTEEASERVVDQHRAEQHRPAPAPAGARDRPG